MSTLEIYESCRAQSCSRRGGKFPVMTYMAIGIVLTCSICAVLADAKNRAPREVPKQSIKQYIEPIDTKLTVPNTDGWLPPEKLRELNSYE